MERFGQDIERGEHRVDLTSLTIQIIDNLCLHLNFRKKSND